MTSSPASEVKVKSGASSPSRTAVGVIRVSRVGSRSGETFVSPTEQRTRIEEACARDGLALVDVLEELDVSGGAALAKRPGLRRAVEMVEAGEAEVVVVAYLDRLVRSLQVQAEVVSRVEQAGGAILAVDVGAVSYGSSAQWLSASMLGAVGEYHRRVTAERTADAKRRAVARGVPPFPRIPPGYRRDPEGRLEPNPGEASAVAEAFRLRAGGATVMDVRAHLRDHGIDRSFHGTQSMLTSRVYLGELRFGDLVNDASHPAIVDADTWARVQRMRSPRGRRARSDRLLARLDVLRCGSCGARMVVGTAHNGEYALYRCPPVGDCERRVTISAEKAEERVWKATVAILRDTKGTASTGDRVDRARAAYDTADKNLSNAIEALTGMEDIEAAQTKLAALRETRDQTLAELEHAEAASGPALTITADDENLTDDEKRALIRAVIDRAEVSPGRGADRITIRAR